MMSAYLPRRTPIFTKTEAEIKEAELGVETENSKMFGFTLEHYAFIADIHFREPIRTWDAEKKADV